MSLYSQRYAHEFEPSNPFGQAAFPEPAVPALEKCCVTLDPEDGPYFDMLAQVWRVRFGGEVRFDTFPISGGGEAWALFRNLKSEAES